MISPGKASRPRALAEAAGIAGFGLLHAVSAGAVLLAGLWLAAPGVLESGSAGRPWSSSVALGLACLRVPLESGDVSGTFAPLTGLAVTVWGLGSAVRQRSPGWPGARLSHVAAVAVAFSLACLVAAMAARADAPMKPAALAAAAAGLLWGALAAVWGTRRPGAGGSTRRERLARIVSRPRSGPAVLTVAVTAALAAVAFAVLLAAALAGVAASAALGGVVLGIAAAPNAVAAVASVGLGAPVELVLGGTAVGDATRETFALWDWAGQGLAPAHVLALALVPAAGVLIGGRAAPGNPAPGNPAPGTPAPGGPAPGSPALRRGLANGLLLGAVLVAVGWTGSLQADAGPGPVAAVLRLGVPAGQVLGLSVLWGIAGAYLGPLLPRREGRDRRSRVRGS